MTDARALDDLVRAAQASGPAFEADDMAFFAAALRRRSGIVLPDSKAALVFRRLAPRVRELGHASFAEYRRRLADTGDAEWDRVVELLTTNHSRFFREIHHFKLLAKHVANLAGQGVRRLRLWSAACALGQEPYSMAMLLAHQTRDTPGVDARVLATDIDRTALAKAQEGRYAPDDVGRLPAFARPFMTRGADGLASVTDAPRALVRFKHHNMIGDDWPMRGPFDAIFCRNMLIYLAPQDQATIVARLASLLKTGGLLCLGHSEIARDRKLPIERLEVPSSYVRI
jgi:chemotaxis protein methyltransferase CheR